MSDRGTISKRPGKVECWKCGAWLHPRTDGTLRKHNIPQPPWKRLPKVGCPASGALERYAGWVRAPADTPNHTETA